MLDFSKKKNRSQLVKFLKNVDSSSFIAVDTNGKPLTGLANVKGGIVRIATDYSLVTFKEIEGITSKSFEFDGYLNLTDTKLLTDIESGCSEKDGSDIISTIENYLVVEPYAARIKELYDTWDGYLLDFENTNYSRYTFTKDFTDTLKEWLDRTDERSYYFRLKDLHQFGPLRIYGPVESFELDNSNEKYVKFETQRNFDLVDLRVYFPSELLKFFSAIGSEIKLEIREFKKVKSALYMVKYQMVLSETEITFYGVIG